MHKKSINDKIKNAKNRKELFILIFLMIKERKKWWLLPLLIILLILSLFINIFNSQSILPAIYAFF